MHPPHALILQHINDTVKEPSKYTSVIFPTQAVCIHIYKHKVQIKLSDGKPDLEKYSSYHLSDFLKKMYLFVREKQREGGRTEGEGERNSKQTPH